MVVSVNVHSIPARRQPEPCESVARTAPTHLAPYVVGCSAFRAGGGTPVRHRLLPVNATVLVIDVTGADRLVTGARSAYGIHTTRRWREGVTVGLTPAGTAALLGVPAREFVGGTVELADVLGRRREEELAERLAEAGPGRLDVLEETMGTWLEAGTGSPATTLVAAAWTRLQRQGRRIPVSVLAARLGVSRRSLELRFQREIGMPPGQVARIARLQHAVGRLADPSSGLAAIAAACGYADQPHFTRDVRELTGLTPTALCANLQYREPAPG
ncbi:helix-turn-helix transcriptional regulator [Streptomyces phytophilus]|uniref:helix-turn-helix transcriptional regulator n=1 Tax=Streptomyces phytophilus TaxID=722715 RepID=UPI002867DE45|nr:helix-turn-helix transcriptional regulator [Streptomyces phytophilus]